MKRAPIGVATALAAKAGDPDAIMAVIASLEPRIGGLVWGRFRFLDEEEIRAELAKLVVEQLPRWDPERYPELHVWFYGQMHSALANYAGRMAGPVRNIRNRRTPKDKRPAPPVRVDIEALDGWEAAGAADAPIAQVAARRSEARAQDALACLEKAQKRALWVRYFRTDPDATDKLKEVGEMLGVSRQKASHLITEGLREVAALVRARAI